MIRPSPTARSTPLQRLDGAEPHRHPLDGQGGRGRRGHPPTFAVASDPVTGTVRSGAAAAAARRRTRVLARRRPAKAPSGRSRRTTMRHEAAEDPEPRRREVELIGEELRTDAQQEPGGDAARDHPDAGNEHPGGDQHPLQRGERIGTDGADAVGPDRAAEGRRAPPRSRTPRGDGTGRRCRQPVAARSDARMATRRWPNGERRRTHTASGGHAGERQREHQLAPLVQPCCPPVMAREAAGRASSCERGAGHGWRRRRPT